MSLQGNINKVVPEFLKAMRNASLKGRVGKDGGMLGTQKIYGYVCNVHDFDDEDESLRGTVDVQEFGKGTYDQYYDDDDYIDGAGCHVGVLLSAINNNKNGVWLMPMLYSEVIIVQDPTGNNEYVLMCSHVDVIHLQSHKTIKVGVTETQEFQEGADGPDFEDLEETGNATSTDYDKDQILDTVKTKDGEVTVKRTIDGVVVNAKDSVVTIKSDGSVSVQCKKVTVNADNSVDVKSDGITVTGQTTEFKEGVLIRKGTSNADAQGGFCGIPVCPFTGAVHVGSTITA